MLLGIFPVPLLALLNNVSRGLLGASLGTQLQHWWLLTPIAPERASYSPVVFMLSTVVLVAAVVLGVRLFYHGRIRKAAPWGCGFPLLTPRMQDTAEGFGQPIRQIFEPFFRIQRALPSPFDTSPHYRVRVEDHFWYALYAPIAGLVRRISSLAGAVQQGRISVYLLYSFLTLIALLAFVL